MCDVLIAEKKDDGSVQSTVIEGEVREFAELNKETKKRRDNMDAEVATNQKNMEAQCKAEEWRKQREAKLLRKKKAAYMDMTVCVGFLAMLCLAVSLLARNYLIDVRVAWVTVSLSAVWTSYKIGRLCGRFERG